MRLFIRNVLAFLSVPLAFFALNCFINFLIFSNQSLPLNSSEILIVGDSHPQTSIVPELFESAQNIAQESEPLVLTYWKIRKILASYKPDTLILGFAPHNISEYNDLKFSDKRWSVEMFTRSYPIQDLRKLSTEIPVEFLTFYFTLLREIGYYPKKNHIHYLGGYEPKDTVGDTNDWEATINRHFYHQGYELKASSSSIKYLNLIVELCKENNIVIVFVSSPVSLTYWHNIPHGIKNKFLELEQEYGNSAIMFNRSNSGYPESMFYNSDHLNYKGAERFTGELIDYLRQLK